eukprot:m.131597 g.131597  ORF g.131597 m.131597 type:complete len:248 (-) comp14629_c0_seq1:1886-2629(-)
MFVFSVSNMPHYHLLVILLCFDLKFLKAQCPPKVSSNENNVYGRAGLRKDKPPIYYLGDKTNIDECIAAGRQGKSGVAPIQSVTWHGPAVSRYGKGCYGDVSSYWQPREESNISSALFVPCYGCSTERLCMADNATGSITDLSSCNATCSKMPKPKKRPNGLSKSIGTLALIGFFGGLVVPYFFIGMLVQRFRYEQTGSDLIPNKIFWMKFFGYAKIGCVFVWYSIRGKGSQAGYESIAGPQSWVSA